jgi:hypothetical protein
MTTVVIIIAYTLFILAVRYIVLASHEFEGSEEKTGAQPAQAQRNDLREPTPPQLRVS